MKVFLDMVGCRLNQSEIEAFASQFRLAGHTLVSDAASADLVVINTCTVTAPAASDSRSKVRQALHSGARQVVVTGCYATLNPQKLAELSPSIRVITNSAKDNLVPSVLDLPASYFDHSPAHRQPIPGSRLRTRAFIKVQDGCDNHCAYCITRLARGPGHSRPLGDILADVLSALDGGAQEIVLTGVHLGSWGHDFQPISQLIHLVRSILDATPTPRLHLSSIEPWDVSPEFLTLWQDPRLCPHLHLPLQSGCDATLRRMGRKITSAAFAGLVELARRTIPGVSITTDIITGFPGETELEFQESLAFVQRMNFAGGHVFTYSPRPGTAAMSLPAQVNPSTAKNRSAFVRQVIAASAAAYRQAHLGLNLAVLWEKATPTDEQHWLLNGLSANYLRVHALSPSPCWNQIMTVHISSVQQDGLSGEILLT